MHFTTIFSSCSLVRSFRTITVTLMVMTQIITVNTLIAQASDSNKAALETPSSDKGLQLPVMTVKQRDAIVNPAEGSVIYNKNAKKPQFYDGSTWKFFDTNHYIGENYGGGIVFYIDSTGEHGLVAAPSDQSAQAEWGFFEKPAEAHGKSIGTGQSNTNKITKKSNTQGTAARLCDELQLNNYNDWFLPSLDELNLMYQNLKMKGLGNFDAADYWTSSETDFNNAWLQSFRDGFASESTVKKTVHVRAIRAF